jgi:hypothetical protein
MTTYSYSAILVQQTDSSKPMLLLSAPAAEIQKWAGIPQKKRFTSVDDKQGEEAIGFQREENGKRINEIGQFFNDDQNVIQNPLLCATRVDDKSTLDFIVSQDNGNGTQIGKLIINVPDYSKVPFKDLLAQVRNYLQKRVPALENRKPSESLILSLKRSASHIGHLANELESEDFEGTEEENEETREVSNDNADNGDSVTASLFEESHILDFWDEIASRHEVAKLIPEDLYGDSFLGFNRDALAAYIYPVVLVDGQHRLKGAIRAAQTKVKSTDLQNEIENRILDGELPDEVEEQLLVRESRRLPISLLISADPAEQVFQFVIVNQKATPIGRALLGTIVSTTLSREEMGQVANRLKNAGIELEESQAVTYLARHRDSPFFGKIESGVGANGDGKDRLQWNVFSSLVSIFRNLKGGKLFHEKLDHAQIWKNNYLDSSAIVANFSEKGFNTPEEYWRQVDGPWRDIFIAFWLDIKSYFGSENLDAPLFNYWGMPRESNLFNKPSLTILAADFFQYLTDMRTPINSVSEINELVKNWLVGVKPGYFSRDWNLQGVKKDSDGIRRAWSIAWKDYRKDINAPLPNAKTVYRTPKAGQF